MRAMARRAATVWRFLDRRPFRAGPARETAVPRSFQERLGTAPRLLDGAVVDGEERIAREPRNAHAEGDHVHRPDRVVEGDRQGDLLYGRLARNLGNGLDTRHHGGGSPCRGGNSLSETTR